MANEKVEQLRKLLVLPKGAASVPQVREALSGSNVTVISDADAAAPLRDFDLVILDVDASADPIGTAHRLVSECELPVVFLLSAALEHRAAALEEIGGYGCVLKEAGAFTLRQATRTALELADARRRAEAGHETPEAEQFRFLVQSQSDLVVRVNADGIFEFVSDSYCKLFGKSREELVGSSFVPLVHEEDRAHTEREMQKLFEPPYTCRIEQRAMTKHGWRWLEWEDASVLDEEGTVTAIVGTGRDVTERKEAERRRRESEERFQKVLEKLPIPIVVSEGSEEYVVSVNAKFTEVFGYTLEDIPYVEAWWPKAYPDEAYRTRVQTEWDARKRAGSDGKSEFAPMNAYVTCKNGTERYVSVRAYSLGDVLIVAFLDLTEMQAAQTRLEELVEVKERLISEINHRVKNNLNMVSSMVSLKDAELGDTADLTDIRNQIQAISFIHEKLHARSDAIEVDFGAYIGSLLPEAFSFSPRAVTLNIDIEEIRLPAGTAAVLGVIINELATNAMKHGFGGTEEPIFSLSLGADEGAGEFLLVVSNSGPPIPADVDLTNPSGLGLRLISALVEQLRGELSLERAPSPTFRIRFPAAG